MSNLEEAYDAALKEMGLSRGEYWRELSDAEAKRLIAIQWVIAHEAIYKIGKHFAQHPKRMVEALEEIAKVTNATIDFIKEEMSNGQHQ